MFLTDAMPGSTRRVVDATRGRAHTLLRVLAAEGQDRSTVAQSPDGHDFAVKGHFGFASSKSSIEFVNHADGVPIELRLKGDVSGYPKSLVVRRADWACSGLTGRPASSLAMLACEHIDCQY